jgi:4-carboxymuconolactone decarboxylase
MRASRRCDPIDTRTVEPHERILCKLSIRDDAYLDSLLADDDGNLDASALDERAHALVRLGALIALDATVPSYLEATERAARCGASPDEIVGTLIAVLPAAGVARVVSAAPRLGLALGFDVAAALER